MLTRDEWMPILEQKESFPPPPTKSENNHTTLLCVGTDLLIFNLNRNNKAVYM